MTQKRFLYGVLEFTSKCRVQISGVPFRAFDPCSTPNEPSAAPPKAIACHKHYDTDMWCKVDRESGGLVEILGPVGRASVESAVLLQAFGVLPCRYPDTVRLTGDQGSECGTRELNFQGAITIDGPDTRDYDDAITVQMSDDGRTVELGIHIADVTGLDPAVLDWAFLRASSVYCADGKKYPMLPPDLAHDKISLVAGSVRPCMSLVLSYEKDTLRLAKEPMWGFSAVSIAANVTYDDFATADEHAFARGFLKAVSEEAPSAEDMVAWAMIQYNRFFGELVAQRCPDALLRVQTEPGQAALYQMATHKGTHASMQSQMYGHFTSPIRRCSDMYNQFLIKGIAGVWARADSDVSKLNKAMDRVRRYHAHDATTNLAYVAKERPLVLDARACSSDDGRVIRIWVPTMKRWVSVPISDSYYAEPLSQAVRDASEGTTFRVELFGIVKNHRTQLRLRLLDAGQAAQPKQQVPLDRDGPHVCMDAAHAGAFETHHTTESGQARIEALAGYPLDGFQLKALRVIMEGKDLLGMAPTGSGKTILALMGIVLRAFDVGKRAILTSPIKALSNQKFYEFSQWFDRMGMRRRISLLTGDIQARAAPAGGDGAPELLIMTSEILENKLDSQARSGVQDPDLANVTLVVMDEVHYINDPSRGSTWERSIMMLPETVQLVALSATLDSPERFLSWLERRRPADLVQRHDRHVPLHIGGFSTAGNNCQFMQFYGTHTDGAGFSTTAYAEWSKPFASQASRGNLTQNVNGLVSSLEKADKMPAIVFCMSRNRCVAAAQAVTRNLMLPNKPARSKDHDDYEWEWIMEQHQDEVREVRGRQDAMFRAHLLRYKDTLEALPGYPEFKDMLDRGIGYHHAGMLPLLREYVEILFQNRLLKVVFATETLGVGINMPARTVIFTQLDKPTGGQAGGSRLLRADEFWQMAGRSGRRGMDERGFVVIHPLSTGAMSGAHEVMSVACGKVQPASSQLAVSPLFVLKHLQEGQGVMDRTFLNHIAKRQRAALEQQLNALPKMAEDAKFIASKHAEAERKLTCIDGFIKPTPKQRKAYEAVMREMEAKAGGKAALEAMRKHLSERQSIANDMAMIDKAVEADWDASLSWLSTHGFADLATGLPTVAGRATSGLHDAMPLVRGRMASAGALDGLEFNDLVCWLALFGESMRRGDDMCVQEDHGPAFMHLLEATQEAVDELRGGETEPGELQLASADALRVWLQSDKDIRAIAALLDPHQLGVFVKLVLRVVALTEELRPVLLGLEKFELYNALENVHARLLGGVVTNASLYVMMNA